MMDQARAGELYANQVARSAMGETAWPTIVMGAGLIGFYIGTTAGFATGALPLWPAAALVAIIVYAIYTVVHEAVHGSISGRNTRLKWLNEWLGYLGGQIIGAPFTALRKEHIAHHNSTNQHGKDPDLELVGGSLLKVVGGAVKTMPLQVKYYTQNNWTHASSRDRITLVLEIAVILTWRIGVFYALGLYAAAVLLVFANCSASS